MNYMGEGQAPTKKVLPMPVCDVSCVVTDLTHSFPSGQAKRSPHFSVDRGTFYHYYSYYYLLLANNTWFTLLLLWE